MFWGIGWEKYFLMTHCQFVRYFAGQNLEKFWQVIFPSQSLNFDEEKWNEENTKFPQAFGGECKADF